MHTLYILSFLIYLIVKIGVTIKLTLICNLIITFNLSGSLVLQMIKSCLQCWETWVQSLVWEDSLEQEMATHSSILVWKIPWMEEPCRLQSIGSQRVGHNRATNIKRGSYFFIYRIIVTLKILSPRSSSVVLMNCFTHIFLILNGFFKFPIYLFL